MSCAPEEGTTIVAHQLPCAYQSFDSGFCPVTAPPAEPAVVDAYDCAWNPVAVVAFAAAPPAAQTTHARTAAQPAAVSRRDEPRATHRIEAYIGWNLSRKGHARSQTEVEKHRLEPVLR